MRIKKLELTEAIRARIGVVRICQENVTGGGFGLSPSDLSYVLAELAEEVLAEVTRQELMRAERIDRVDAMVDRQPVGVVDLELRRKRRDRA